MPAIPCLSAALAVLYIMKRDDILKKAAEKSIYLHEKLDAALGSHHNVGEIRHIGLINAIELVEDKESKRPFNAEKRIGWHIFRKAMDLGLVLRPIGDILYFNPPLTIEKRNHGRSRPSLCRGRPRRTGRRLSRQCCV